MKLTLSLSNPVLERALILSSSTWNVIHAECTINYEGKQYEMRIAWAVHPNMGALSAWKTTTHTQFAIQFRRVAKRIFICSYCCCCCCSNVRNNADVYTLTRVSVIVAVFSQYCGSNCYLFFKSQCCRFYTFPNASEFFISQMKITLFILHTRTIPPFLHTELPLIHVLHN